VAFAFLEFTKICSIDSEAKIYLNNKEAESATKESKSSLIKLAVSVPISRDSGDGVFNSLEILRGVSLAQEEINKEGISFDRNKKGYLQISIIDDGSKNRSTEEEIAQKAANFLANNDSIVGVIGHFSSNATEAASRIYKKYGLVAISPTSTAVRGNSMWQFVPFLSNKLKLEPNIFRTSPDDSYSAHKLVDYLSQYNLLHPKKPIANIAIIYEKNNKYGELYKQHFQEYFQENGGRIVNDDNPDRDVCKLDLKLANNKTKECIDKLKKDNNVDALLLVPSTEKSHYVQKIISIIPELNNNESKYLQLLGTDSTYNMAFLSKITQGMVVAVPLPAQEFHGLQNMNWRSKMSYDATQALVEGVKGVKCSSEKNSNKCIRNQLHGVLSDRDFKADGVLGKGTVLFNDLGDRKVNDNLEVLVCVKQQKEKYVFETLNGKNLCN
jgi:ABC-type branched-subunit amino acid transport system substrate-binding protein